MGHFRKENNDEEIKTNLELKNGKIHILLIHTSISNGNKPEEIYVTKINKIIDDMQEKGYEIVDVKLEIGGTQGLSYETLVLYR